MNKKFLIVGVILLILISVSGLSFGRFLKMKQSGKSQTQSLSATPVPVEMETWEDPSEFSFKYPKNLKLDPHTEDNENYAHIELTEPGSPGSIILWTKDTNYKTVDDYISGNKIESFIGSSLGDLPAVKILDSTDNKKYSLITIRNGYLYQIEVNGGWTDTFNLIIDSYKFSESKALEKPATDNFQQAPAASEEIYSEEEVIE